MRLDVEQARRSFPALATDWALFDNAGGSVTPTPVIDRVHAYLRRHQVQLGASYALSAEATTLVESGRRAAAELIGADPGEVVLGASTTANVGMLARALRPSMRPGDEIVVTNLDHEANVGAWRRLAESGIVVREWSFNRDTAMLEPDDLVPLLTERTQLVCFTHCSNLVGAFHDVAAITRMVHAAGARVMVDGVAYAPHRHARVRDLEADYYAVSLYKVFGPHLGMLYGRRDLFLDAAGQNHFFIAEDEVPYKLMPGNVSHELAAALPGIGEYLDLVHERAYPGVHGDASHRLERVFELFAAHERELGERFLSFASGKPELRLLGPATADPAARAPIFSFSVEGRSSREIVEAVDTHRVAIRWGHFYAKRAVDALGLGDEGVVRVSMLHYNTTDEVDRLIRALDAAI